MTINDLINQLNLFKDKNMEVRISTEDWSSKYDALINDIEVIINKEDKYIRLTE